MPSTITLAAPRLQVGWRCRQCRFEGWIAPTWPLPMQGTVWDETKGRELRDAIRAALMPIHWRKHHCLSTHDGFELFPYVARGQQVVGRI